MSEYSLRRAGLVMIVVTLAARAIGYLREIVIASIFGADSAVDLYLAALTVPAIAVSTAYYAIPNAFIPMWSSTSASRRATRVGGYVLIGAAVLSAVLWLTASALVRSLASGFDSAALSTTASLLRICSWAILAAAAEALFRSRLLAARRFALPTFSFALQSVGIMLACIFWSVHGPYALAWGFLIGTAAAAMWNLILLATLPEQVSEAQLDERSDDARGLLTAVLAILMIDALSQLFGVVDRSLASSLPEGSIASLNYASMLSGFPQAIFGVAVATAVFPYLSMTVVTNDRERLYAILDRAVRWTIVLVTPVIIWFAFFSIEIVRVLYERGAFDTASSNASGSVLLYLSIGILPTILIALWSRVLYAQGKWRWPLAAALLAIVAKFLFARWWVQLYGINGLAAATSTAFVLSMCLLGLTLESRIRSYIFAWVGLALKVALLVAVPAAVVKWLPWRPLDELVGVRLGLGILTGVATLAILGKKWRVVELISLRESIRARLARAT